MGISARDEVILFCTIAQKMAGSDSHNSLWGICVFWTDTGKAYVYYCIWIDSGVDFFMADTDWKRRAGKILLLLFVISCMESFCEIGIAALLERYGGTVLAEKWGYLGGSMATLGILTALKAVNARKHWMKKENMIRFIRKWTVLLIILMTLEVILTAAGLNYVKRYISDDRFKGFAGIFSSGAYFAICVLAVFFHLYQKRE